jgi:hypothetical protein
MSKGLEEQAGREFLRQSFCRIPRALARRAGRTIPSTTLAHDQPSDALWSIALAGAGGAQAQRWPLPDPEQTTGTKSHSIFQTYANVVMVSIGRDAARQHSATKRELSFRISVRVMSWINVRNAALVVTE